MAKHASEYIRDMIHAIGGMPDSRLDLVSVLNEAIEYLFNYHEWKWRKRPPISLGVTLDQNYINLPDDVGDIVSCRTTSNLFKTCILTSVELITFQRGAFNKSSGAAIYAAIAFPSQESSSQAPPPPRLEIYPTPTATEADVLQLEYRAGAIRVRYDPTTSPLYNDVPNIPVKLERALSLLCRAFVKHYEDETESIDLADFEREIQKHMDSDGRVQTAFGQLQNGAARYRKRQIRYRPFITIPAHEG